MIFGKLQQWWDDYAFEVLFISCIVFILLGSLFNRKNQGTYNRYFFNPFENPRKIFDYERSPSPTVRQGKESLGEGICRRHLERVFGRPFNKARPDFLRNPVTGGDFNLELDCFNPELKLALEYNGAQHYKYVPYFHRNKEAFYNQKYRDEMKRTKCKEHGIKLIEVPYTVKSDDLEAYVNSELKKFGFL